MLGSQGRRERQKKNATREIKGTKDAKDKIMMQQRYQMVRSEKGQGRQLMKRHTPAHPGPYKATVRSGRREGCQGKKFKVLAKEHVATVKKSDQKRTNGGDPGNRSNEKKRGELGLAQSEKGAKRRMQYLAGRPDRGSPLRGSASLRRAAAPRPKTRKY